VLHLYTTIEQRYALATRQLSVIRLLETAGPTMKPDWLLDQKNDVARLAWIAPCMILLPIVLGTYVWIIWKSNFLYAIASLFLCDLLPHPEEHELFGETPPEIGVFTLNETFGCILCGNMLLLDLQARYQATRSLLNQVSVPYLPSRNLRSYLNSPHRCLL
jgi:hypothetical protein